MTKCEKCRAKFEPKRADQKYCSPNCRKLAYEQTDAARKRKKRYEHTVGGTLTQFKYDQKRKGQRPKKKTLPRPPFYIRPKGAELRKLRAEAKRLDKLAELRTASVESKQKEMREDILVGAAKYGVPPEQFVDIKTKEAFPEGLPTRWQPVRWEYYATEAECKDVRVRFHLQKVEALMQEKQLQPREALIEYKQALIKDKVGMVMTRFSFMEMGAKSQGRGGLPMGAIDKLMHEELDDDFDYKWAGGQPWGSGKWGADKWKAEDNDTIII